MDSAREAAARAYIGGEYGALDIPGASFKREALECIFEAGAEWQRTRVEPVPDVEKPDAREIALRAQAHADMGLDKGPSEFARVGWGYAYNGYHEGYRLGFNNGVAASRKEAQ